MHTKIITRLSLLASVLVMPACGGSNDSGLFVDWYVEDVAMASNQQAPTCEEVGATTVVFDATNVTRNIVVPPVSVPCNAYEYTTPVLTTGTYSVNMRLLRSDNVQVSSLNIPNLPVNRGGITDIGTVIFEVQSFQTQWVVTRAAAPAVPVSCLSVGASQVEFTATPAGTGTGLAPFVFRFACGDAVGVTQAVPDGDYTLQFRLLDAAGNSLSALQMAYTTPVGARAILPPVTFTVL